MTYTPYCPYNPFKVPSKAHEKEEMFYVSRPRHIASECSNKRVITLADVMNLTPIGLEVLVLKILKQNGQSFP